MKGLPVEVKEVVLSDGYSSPEAFHQCFWEDGAANKYSRLDRYGKGLFVVRKIVEIPEDVLEFDPLMGKLRGLLDAARAVVSNWEKQKQEEEARAEEACT